MDDDHMPYIFIIDLDGTIIGDCTYQCDIYNIENIMKKNAIRRVKTMNALYENIKNKGFSYFDSFYLLHGNHRNREDTKISPQTPPQKSSLRGNPATAKRILSLNLL